MTHFRNDESVSASVAPNSPSIATVATHAPELIPANSLRSFPIRGNAGNRLAQLSSTMKARCTPYAPTLCLPLSGLSRTIEFCKSADTSIWSRRLWDSLGMPRASSIACTAQMTLLGFSPSTHCSMIPMRGSSIPEAAWSAMGSSTWQR